MPSFEIVVPRSVLLTKLAKAGISQFVFKSVRTKINPWFSSAGFSVIVL
jgi:hypothetical protein